MTMVALGSVEPWRILLATFIVLLTVGLCFLTYNGIETIIRRRKLRDIPLGSGHLPVLGHIVALLNAPEPWKLMLKWLNDSNSDIVRFCLPFDDWVVVRGAEPMRAVLQTQIRDFNKEMDLSFHPFLCILGTGLVTSHGELWQTQRRLMTPAFKGEILQDVISVSLRATARLSAKLDACQASASTIEIDEEFRLLTLQVRTFTMYTAV
jgi:cytochrome P450